MGPDAGPPTSPGTATGHPTTSAPARCLMPAEFQTRGAPTLTPAPLHEEERPVTLACSRQGRFCGSTAQRELVGLRCLFPGCAPETRGQSVTHDTGVALL